MCLPLSTCFLSLLSYLIFISYYKNDSVFDQYENTNELLTIDINTNNINYNKEHTRLLLLDKDLHRNYTSHTDVTHIQQHINGIELMNHHHLQSQVSPTTLCLQTITIQPIITSNTIYQPQHPYQQQQLYKQQHEQIRAIKDYSNQYHNNISHTDTILSNTSQKDIENEENHPNTDKYNDIQVSFILYINY